MGDRVHNASKKFWNFEIVELQLEFFVQGNFTASGSDMGELVKLRFPQGGSIVSRR
jgi:hypothetical protein